MAILPIDPYVIPADTPENRVHWCPDPRRAVLLVHEMQNYFLRVFSRWGAPWRELMANTLALREHCADAGIPVVYTAQPPAQSTEQRGLTRDFWGPGVGPDPTEARIVDELAPRPGDIRITTWRYSAFARTGLAGMLADMGRDQVIICGLYAHLGVLMTACDAFMRDIQAFVVSDAIADFSLDHHRMALHYAAQRCAVVLPTRDTIRTLATAAAEAASSPEPLQIGETTIPARTPTPIRTPIPARPPVPAGPPVPARPPVPAGPPVPPRPAVPAGPPVPARAPVPAGPPVPPRPAVPARAPVPAGPPVPPRPAVPARPHVPAGPPVPARPAVPAAAATSAPAAMDTVPGESQTPAAAAPPRTPVPLGAAAPARALALHDELLVGSDGRRR